MPQFSGETDTTHVVTLPSEIESARWNRRQAAPGGTVGLTIRTLFCGDGSTLQIDLVDAQGTTHSSLSGELVGNEVTVDLSVPRNAKGGLLAKVTFPNHGLSAESPALEITEPVRVRGARWSHSEVRRGEVVTLTAEARGAPDGRSAPIRIFQRDPGPGAHDPVTQLRPTVQDGAVEVKWQFAYPGKTADIVPDWEAADGYTQPAFFYAVDVTGVTADSRTAKSKGIMTFVDDLNVQLLEADTHAPLTDQKATVTLANGQTKETSLTAEGRLQLKDMPPGPAKVQLPEYTPPIDADGAKSGNTRKGVPEGARSFTMKSKASTLTVPTGREATVYVVPPQIDAHLEQGLFGERLSGADYQLTVKTTDGTTLTFEGTVGTEGRLRQALPLGAVAATLTLKTGSGRLTVPIDLSTLSGEKETTGLQQRLAQVGRYAGRTDGTADVVTRGGLFSLQKRMGTAPTGRVANAERAMLDGLRFRNG